MGEANYKKQIRAAVRGLWTGAFTFEDFDEIMKGTIRRGMTQAWIEGAKPCGIALDDLSDAESLALAQIISSQFDYIDGFRDFVDANSKVNKGKLGQGLARAELWINRYGEARNQAKAMACADRKLKWQINAKCREHCFPAGTMVNCLEGDKPIETIKVGDFVLTTKGYYKVTKLFKHYHKGNLVKIFSNNQNVTSTPNHPFLVNGEWKRADEIILTDNVMLFQNMFYQFFTHIAFPYSFNNVSTRCKIFILGFISFLLSFLPVSQILKSWMSMPVITIGLNNKIFNSNIYNKIWFDKILMLKNNSKFNKIAYKFFFQFCGLIFSYLLLTYGYVFEHSIFPFFILPMFSYFLFNFFFFHRVISNHILLSLIMNNPMRSFFIKFQTQAICFSYNLVRCQFENFRNLFSSHSAIVLNKKISFFLIPYFRIISKFSFEGRFSNHVSFAKLIFPSSLMTTNGTSFPINSFMSNWAYINSGFVSTSGGTKIKGTLFRRRGIYKSFKIISTLFTNKSGYNFTFLFTKIWMFWFSYPIIISTSKTTIFRFLASVYERFATVLAGMSKIWHKSPLLHQSNVTDIQVLYNQNCYVYNLEVGKVHNYMANGFLVHNCNSCRKLNGKVKRGSYWQKTIMPRSKNLECGGWRCCCELIPTDDPISKGKLSF